MIEIPVLRNVGGRMLPLSKCYDNANTAKRVISKLRKEGALFTTREIVVAQKTLTLIYTQE